ncbi:Grm7, partial [Symbiodinium sp. KB8]
ASISLRIGTTHLQPDVGGATPVVGLVGARASSVSGPIATLAAVQKAYPFFLRTVPPDSLQALALWQWILKFDVPLATCLYSSESYGQGLFNEILDLAREARESLMAVRQIGSKFLVLAMQSKMIVAWI